jgi:ribosome-associated heat shock protein Hsp15
LAKIGKIMRIDKFLWSVRVYKTRTLAADEVKKNRVTILDQSVKASREVKLGEIIKIRKNQIDFKIQVLAIPKSRVGAKLVPDYIVDKTEKDQYDLLSLRKSEQNYYRAKGEGRPTKKDRRDIEEYTDNRNLDSESNENSTQGDSFFSLLEQDDAEE